MAAQHDVVEAVECLLQKNADPSAVDKVLLFLSRGGLMHNVLKTTLGLVVTFRSCNATYDLLVLLYRYFIIVSRIIQCSPHKSNLLTTNFRFFRRILISFPLYCTKHRRERSLFSNISDRERRAQTTLIAGR